MSRGTCDISAATTTRNWLHAQKTEREMNGMEFLASYSLWLIMHIIENAVLIAAC